MPLADLYELYELLSHRPNERAILRRAFNLAVEKGTLAVAPFKIPKLALNNVRTGFMEHDEYTRMRDALPSYLKPVLIFAY